MILFSAGGVHGSELLSPWMKTHFARTRRTEVMWPKVPGFCGSDGHRDLAVSLVLAAAARVKATAYFSPLAKTNCELKCTKSCVPNNCDPTVLTFIQPRTLTDYMSF